ncbi:MAG: ATP-dependent Clp protease adaptor ClpS [Sulfurovaceae bacterium]|nr:ATP-dependent Clp protease adaptor ClpS [Sulfurovaceae bacterium]
MPKIDEEIEIKLAVAEPTKYKVLLHNDDYTSMDFVVEILMGVFHKSMLESEQIMFNIHKKGRAICGVYTFEIAQTKVQQVKEMAKSSGFPLLATVEQE